MFYPCAWLILIFAVMLGSAHGRITINCRKKCNKDIQACANELKRGCRFKGVRELPSPNPGDVTAPPPSTLTSSWFVSSKKSGGKKLGLNVTWSHKGTDLSPPEDHVTGYLVAVRLDGAERKFQMVFNFSKHSKDISKHMVFFNFIFTESDLVREGCSYMISVLSIPMFHPRTEILKKDCSLDIPDCGEDATIATTEVCKKEEKAKEKRRKRRQKKKREKEKRKKNANDLDRHDEPSSLTYIVVGLAAALFIVIMIFVAFVCVWMCRRRRDKRYEEYQRGEERSRLLILVETTSDDPLYHQAANILATMLGDKQTFNLWNRLKIEEPEEWTAKELRRCGHVVLVCTPTGKQQCDKLIGSNDSYIDPYLAGIHRFTTGTSVKKVGATAVYFDEDESSSVPQNLSKQVQRFQLVESFEKFIKHIGSKVFVPSCDDHVDQLKAAVEQIRNIRPKPVPESAQHIDSNSNDSVCESSAPISCSTFDEIDPHQPIVDKSEVVCSSLEKDSGIF